MEGENYEDPNEQGIDNEKIMEDDEPTTQSGNQDNVSESNVTWQMLQPAETSNQTEAQQSTVPMSSYSYIENELDGSMASIARGHDNCFVDNLSAYHEYNNIYVSSQQQLDYSHYSYSVPENCHYSEAAPQSNSTYSYHYDNNCPPANYGDWNYDSNFYAPEHNNILQSTAENSNWLQTTVNELFADQDMQHEQTEMIEHASETTNHYEQYETLAYNDDSSQFTNNTSSILSPPATPLSSSSQLTENTSTSAADSYLFYIPMRVTRDPKNGNYQMHYDTPMNNYLPQKNKSSHMATAGGGIVDGINKKNPPKTVREMLDEYRQRSFFSDLAPMGFTVPNNVEVNNFVPEYMPPITCGNSIQFPNAVYAPDEASNYVPNQLTYVENTNGFEAPNVTSTVATDSSDYYSSFSVSTTASVSNDSENSFAEKSSFASNKDSPLTPADTDSSVQSPLQCDDSVSSFRPTLPGIQHLRKLLTSDQDSASQVDAARVQEPPEPIDLINIPEFAKGHVDAKEHKPRHFDLVELQIGSYWIRMSESVKPTCHKFKVLFCKRRFSYEFIWPCQKAEADMNELISVHVTFKSVVCLREDGNDLLIHVDTKPQMFSCVKVCSTISNGTSARPFNVKREVDLTNGQLATCAVHRLTLKKNQIAKLKNFLTAFDDRFWYLLQRKIPDDAYLAANFEDVAQQHIDNVCDKKKPSKTVPAASTSSQSANSCTCKISCRSLRCSCCKLQLKCSSQCQCEQCDNPLNVLCDSGKDFSEILKDKCLMFNIFKYTSMENCLFNLIQLKCCDNIVKVLDMIPGEVNCPHGCNVSYQYSWCHMKLYDESVNARNHCTTCTKCITADSEHSQLCKKSQHLIGQPKGVLTRRRSQALSKTK